MGDGDAKARPSHLVSAHPDGRLMCWSTMSKACVWEIQEEDNEFFCMAFQQDGNTLAVAGKKREVNLYDVETRKRTVSLFHGDGYSTNGHSNRIFSMLYHPTDPNIILSGSWDKLVQIWDVRAGGTARTIRGPFICGDALDVSQDGKTVLTGSCTLEDQVQTWDFGTGEMLQKASWAQPGTSESNKVYSAQFSKGDNGSMVVCAGSGANFARILDAKNGLSLLCDVEGFSKSIVCTDFSQDSHKLAVGSIDGTVKVVNVEDC